TAPEDDGDGGLPKVQNQRLTRRKINPFSGDPSIASDARKVLEPGRFAALAASFKWEQTFVLPTTTCWAKDNAQEVRRYIMDHPKSTWADYAAHFGKSKPTLRAAMKFARGSS